MTLSCQPGPLADLQRIKDFLVRILAQATGREIPEPAATPSPDGPSPLHAWVDVLDLAVTPETLRAALGPAPNPALAGVLLRYYVSKPPGRGREREKIECVSASLARIRVAKETDDSAAAYSISSPRLSQVVTDLERQLTTLLADQCLKDLSKEGRKQASDLELLCHEVEAIQSWEEFLQANPLGRSRELKDLLAGGFIHPRVLAITGLLQVVLERRLGWLVREAAAEMVALATGIMEVGSELVWLDAPSPAIHNLRDLVRLIEQQKPHADRLRAAAEFRDAHQALHAAAESAAPQPAEDSAHPGDLAPAKSVAEVEEGKLLDLHLSIRSALRKVESGQDVTLKLSACPVALTAMQTDVFRTQYDGEKSFRADFADALRRLVLLRTRIGVELTGYKDKIDSTYLWQAHARALHYLTGVAAQAIEAAAPVIAAAEQRGLVDRAAALAEVRQKVAEFSQESQALLQQRGTLEGAATAETAEISLPQELPGQHSAAVH